jgi:hypothetical protein
MKKPLRYACAALALGICLVLAGAVVSKQQERSHRRQAVAEDAMRLPSESQRLMHLADTLDQSQRAALFEQYKVAALFEVSKKYPEPQNGFVGPTPQRLEVVFTHVAPDAQHLGTYRAKGLTRIKGAIQTLAGTIKLRQVRYAWDTGAETYIATGAFHFAQAAGSGRPAATWRGLVALDFEVKDAQVKLVMQEGPMLPVTRGFAFEGTCAPLPAGHPQRVVWAANFGPLGSTILKGFGPGGRSLDVAPRYRKYGWDKYWENDEWWSKAAAPTSSL